jgi:acetyl-CoA carboxylase biotin carboxyl carrier protein
VAGQPGPDALRADPGAERPDPEAERPGEDPERATRIAGRPDEAELLGLIDRFESLLMRSDLAEIEVEAGGLMLRLAKPVTAPPPQAGPAGRAALAISVGGSPTEPVATGAAATDGLESGLHAVVAPLTGVFYASPSPDAAPYVRAGAPVSTGQVIGLIEAMKLFNEIKSDVTGIVHRIAAESGALVKQKQPLIEVRPS